MNKGIVRNKSRAHWLVKMLIKMIILFYLIKLASTGRMIHLFYGGLQINGARVKVLAKSAPLIGGNKFNLKKNMEEMQLKIIDKMSMFLRFMNIFPGFPTFLPPFPSYISILNSNFFYIFSCKTLTNCQCFLLFSTFLYAISCRNFSTFCAIFKVSGNFSIVLVWNGR